MPYIGRGLDRGNYLKLDDISGQFDGSKTTFNLTTGGQPFFPGSAFSLLVSISGVIQEPETAYQINSSELVFTGPPGLGEPFFAVAMSQPINIQTPSDGTISSAKIAAGAVTTEKIADGAVTPHKLRHPCTQIWFHHGATLEDVRRLLGHKSSETTRRYVHKTDDRLIRLASVISV